MDITGVAAKVFIVVAGALGGTVVYAQNQVRYDGIPEWSSLKREPAATCHRQEPYMESMKQQRVRRTVLEVHSIWRNGRAQQPRVIRHLYFREYDAPNSQVVKSQELQRIRAAGLEGQLDLVAISRMQKAKLFSVMHGPSKSDGPVVSYIILLDDRCLSELPMWAESPAAIPEVESQSPLVAEAELGDADRVRRILQEKAFKPSDLDLALFQAVRAPYDNTQVIDLLVQNGANVNATINGRPVLLNAIGRPASVRALINLGAKLQVADANGVTPLQAANQVGDIYSARFLEGAGASH